MKAIQKTINLLEDNYDEVPENFNFKTNMEILGYAIHQLGELEQDSDMTQEDKVQINNIKKLVYRFHETNRTDAGTKVSKCLLQIINFALALPTKESRF